MKDFTVVWHYIANYGVCAVRADSAESAIESVLETYGNTEFREKANLFAFEGDPAAVHTSAKYPEKVVNWRWRAA